ncbi:MAG TPA: PKD domain-containing protein, partial [Bacteroidia bacterium]|nr:PKD domain-containing protein [Bacteroidia bacterium]
PTITAANSSTICNGNAIILSASGPPTTTFSWSPAAGLSSTNSASVTATSTITTTYTITGTVGTCSSTPITTTVNVVAAVTPTVTSNTPCANSNQTLSLTCTPTYTNYVWSGPNGFTSPVQNPTKVNVTAAAAGTYSLLVTDANGCINATTYNVIINPLPVVTGSATPACLGFPINLSAAPVGTYTYNWSSSTGFTSTLQSPTIPMASLANQGSYTVSVTDANGCKGTNTIPIHVIVYQPPIVKVNNISICLLTTGTLTASGAINYGWNPAGDLSTNFGNPVLVTPVALGATTYTVTGTDVNGCVSTATAVVGVNDLPTVSILPALSKGCTPQCDTFVAGGSVGVAYSWSFGNGQGSTVASPTACFTVAGNYQVKLTLTDANQCKNTATASVITYPIPIADFYYTPDPVSILEPTVTFLNSTQGLNIVQYSWDFGDTLGTNFDTSSLAPRHTYINIGSYPVTLIAVSANGCSDTIVRTIVVEQDFALYVPNSFTPNGDGKNEIFKAQGEGITDFKMYIFDRWGNKVFTTYDINIGWDGRINDRGGESLSDDVYVWKIDLRNVAHQGKTYTGTVTMIK